MSTYLVYVNVKATVATFQENMDIYVNMHLISVYEWEIYLGNKREVLVERSRTFVFLEAIRM